jgi:hypothetical protein
MSMNYESAPSGVSYEALLKVLEGRSTIGRPYEERLYMVELTNTLSDLTRRTRLSADQKHSWWDGQEDWGKNFQ